MWKKSESSPGVGNLDLGITNTVFATVNTSISFFLLVLKKDRVPCSSNYFEAYLTILEISGLSCLTMFFSVFFSVSQKKRQCFFAGKTRQIE
jgi:hypothetical protein